VVGSEYQRVKNLNDLMPINVTVTNSGMIALPEIIKKMLLFTLAASRFNSKVCLFSLGQSWRIHAAHWSTTKLQIAWLEHEEYTLSYPKSIKIFSTFPVVASFLNS